MARETNAILGLLLFLLPLFLSGCQRETEDLVCKPVLERLAPTASTRFKVNAGQVTKFHAECKACEESQTFGVRWMLNGKIAGYSNDYVFVACNEDAGIHKLSAQAITYATTDTASIEKVVASHTWNIAVSSISKPTPPSCYEESLDDIRNTSSADDPAEQKKLQSAVTCLDEYLSSYACDFQASYGSGLAKTALFMESFYPLYQRRQSLTQEDIQQIVTTKVEPIRQNFLVVQQKAPDDFSFRVNGAFQIYAFKDDPNLDGNDTIRVFAGGRHDKGEALLAMSVMNLFDAGLSIGLANIGSLVFMLHTPDNSTPVSFSDRLISKIESDPTFMAFADGVDEAGNPVNVGEGREGQRQMLISQNSFIQALQQVSDMLDWVRKEEHDQHDDPIRYWDCGEDGICPKQCSYMDSTYFNSDQRPDKAEWFRKDLATQNYASCSDAKDDYKDRNLNQVCDEAWSKADEGECNGKYDEGEAFGTERIAGAGSPERNGPPIAIAKWQPVLSMIRENIRGPDALDLDKLGEIAAETPPKAVSGFLRGLGIPYPLLRISEFFSTSTSIRDLVPLYDKTERQFIIDLESEPFLDYGYDWRLSEDEFGFDAITNPDPGRDDFDPYCNPDCNENDKLPDNTPVDNDGDGKANGDDRNFISKDLGVEGNFVFDFIDIEQNGLKPDGIHQANEPSEKFEDVGTLNASGRVIGKGDGAWSKADKTHVWPTGSNIGPVSDLVRDPDAPNGTRTELGGLYDNYYYFFQDPVLSGGLRFVVDPYDLSNDLVSANGVSLSDNARLMRFFSKVLETAQSFNVRESNAHPCEKPLAQCNHWTTDSSGGYTK